MRGIRKQLKAIYGPPQIYDVRVPLERDGKAFGEVRVGVATTFLKDELQPLLKQALEFSGAAILIMPDRWRQASPIWPCVRLRPSAAGLT